VPVGWDEMGALVGNACSRAGGTQPACRVACILINGHALWNNERRPMRKLEPREVSIVLIAVAVLTVASIVVWLRSDRPTLADKNTATLEKSEEEPSFTPGSVVYPKMRSQGATMIAGCRTCDLVRSLISMAEQRDAAAVTRTFAAGECEWIPDGTEMVIEESPPLDDNVCARPNARH
jgi:hypothetical protein